MSDHLNEQVQYGCKSGQLYGRQRRRETHCLCDMGLVCSTKTTGGYSVVLMYAGTRRVQRRATLHLGVTELIIDEPGQPLKTWPYSGLRRYGFDKNSFTFEARRAEPGLRGIWALASNKSSKIFKTVEGNVTQLKLKASSRSLGKRSMSHTVEKPKPYSSVHVLLGNTSSSPSLRSSGNGSSMHEELDSADSVSLLRPSAAAVRSVRSSSNPDYFRVTAALRPRAASVCGGECRFGDHSNGPHCCASSHFDAVTRGVGAASGCSEEGRLRVYGKGPHRCCASSRFGAPTYSAGTTLDQVTTKDAEDSSDTMGPEEHEDGKANSIANVGSPVYVIAEV
eukprot:m.175967 g.175967  ORF g.175967 m.175967 type:complete len:337 (-) comp17930_c0_seq1:183-1193(-)